ncbi:MAG: hypothetical protein Q9173_005631 [Seirophora scorigena]
MAESRTISLSTATTISFPNDPNPSVYSVLTQTIQDGKGQPIVIEGSAGAKSTLTLPTIPGFVPTGDGPAIPTAPSTSEVTSTATNSGTTSATTILVSNPPPTSSSGTRVITATAAPQASSGSPNGSTGMSAPNQRAESDSISPGAAAGIGIGCAIAGALIAAAIVALLFRRRRHRRPTRSDVIPLHGYGGSLEKSVASPNLSTTPTAMIEKNLPQPAEDQKLGGEMSRLRTAIKNHVQSYYHTDNVRGSVDQAALGLVAAGNMPLIASTLGTLLANPATRIVAIRFCITWVAISRIDHNCDPSKSFLPPEVASCLVSIGGAREDPSTRMPFMSRWRALTASLLQSKYGDKTTFTSYDARNPNVTAALHALDAILSPFASSSSSEQQQDGGGGSGQERRQKLEEILRRAARFGFLLFAQQSTWDFDWTPPLQQQHAAGRGGALAVAPALVQVGDEAGRRLQRPRVVEEQELARGLEAYL